jgi:NAD(P)-dependent dehydrogenase (short-subunit alcohol dehydrogenase family)
MATWLITGASSGLGFSLAEHVLQHGEQVVLTARTLAPMAELAAQYPATARSFGLDVTDADQRRAAIRFAEEQFGGVDVLVNNAGIDFTGAIEEQHEDDIRSQFEVNFFAPVALLRLVLPGMRARKRGTIINISSMDGIARLPANGIYSATKFALEGLTEALWQEIEPIGLRAFLVEPGSFRTGIEQRTEFSGTGIGAYEATSGAFRNVMATLTPGMFPGDPARAAEAIYQVATADQPRHWVLLGSDALRRVGAKLDALRAEYETGRELAFSTGTRGDGDTVRHHQIKSLCNKCSILPVNEGADVQRDDRRGRPGRIGARRAQ